MARAASQWKSLKRDSTFFEQQQPNNEMNTATPTPRTDAATYRADCLGATLVTNRDLARALERELSADRARLDWLESPAGFDWQWHSAHSVLVRRSAIDAAMKEGA